MRNMGDFANKHDMIHEGFLPSSCSIPPLSLLENRLAARAKRDAKISRRAITIAHALGLILRRFPGSSRFFNDRELEDCVFEFSLRILSHRILSYSFIAICTNRDEWLVWLRRRHRTGGICSRPRRKYRVVRMNVKLDGAFNSLSCIRAKNRDSLRCDAAFTTAMRPMLLLQNEIGFC